MIRRHVVLAVGISSFGVGCVPYPHFERTAPKITAALTQSGEPADNREVLYADGWSTGCSQVFARAVSNAEGEVVLGPRRKFLPWRFLLPADPLFRWHLCLASSPAEPIWEGSATTIVPEHVALACSLDPPVACGEAHAAQQGAAADEPQRVPIELW
jgi:hypothetical protein